jgi:hypothetical protein
MLQSHMHSLLWLIVIIEGDALKDTEELTGCAVHADISIGM